MVQNVSLSNEYSFVGKQQILFASLLRLVQSEEFNCFYVDVMIFFPPEKWRLNHRPLPNVSNCRYY